ncbi:MAG: DUF4147 domain-containing protein [Pirellulales bacterium]|nr:DUF4147 domain-containing protein [Pirellulales bacterium]
MSNCTTLREDAVQIWRSGVAAVRADRLVGEALHVEGEDLAVGPLRLDLKKIRRLAVVGGGKAGAGMASAVERILGVRWLEAKQVVGWVNVPADCVQSLQCIRLHSARPAGVNEPTAEGADGTAAILQIVESLTADDLCLCLLSGGGSALLPAPVPGVTLEDKLAVTRHLSAAGANIAELNVVRKQLSRIKGGGLARACRAGRLIALIISDVCGDPLDVIASGPTVPDASTPQAALEILERFQARSAGISPAVFDYLERAAASPLSLRERARVRAVSLEKGPHPNPLPKGEGTILPQVTNLLIGNNAKAVDAAGREAVRLGYAPVCVSAAEPEGPAEEVGRQLAEQALRMRHGPGPNCLISGGEPVVQLVPAAQRGRGGRNQQLVLAALEQLQTDGADAIVLLSGGTDGEDGPTDAAGALLDAEILRIAAEQGLDPHDFLTRNDAYHFFAPLAALIKTGPTQTNVGDLRVVLVNREAF